MNFTPDPAFLILVTAAMAFRMGRDWDDISPILARMWRRRVIYLRALHVHLIPPRKAHP